MGRINRPSFSYNTSVHEGTGCTPHELIFGNQVRVPSSFCYENEPSTYYSYLTDLFKNINNLQKIARTNIIKAKEKSKAHYDKRVNPVTFHVGEYVLMTNDSKTSKLSNEYLGPYLIVECLDRENIRIKIRNKTRIVHANRLKKCAYDDPG